MNAFYQRILIGIILLGTLIPPAIALQPDSGITISKRQVSLTDLFMEIHNQTGYFFYYNEQDLAGAHKVDIHVVNASLETVLDLCFAGQPIRYELKDGTIIVKVKITERPTPEPLLDLHGTVRDENGQPVMGATVAAGSHATGTDKDGYFELHQIQMKTTTLTISSVGYEPQTVMTRGRNEFTIVLKKSVSKLDDVQVIAYGTTTERLNTGNVSTVKAETIAQQPVSNPLAALEGRVPGLYIQQNSGVPGSSYSLQLRGQSSIVSGNYPYYIIDGVPFTNQAISSPFINGGITGGGDPLSNLNPSDIESIEILKDADATAIYGSRGANGVILITTRKGSNGDTKFSTGVYSGLGAITRRLNLLNTGQYLEMRHEAFSNDGETPGVSDYDLNEYDTTRNTDWQKSLIGGSAHILDVQASISGGNINTQFLMGGGYHRESTVFPGNFADRKASFHFNGNHMSLNKRFRVDLTANYVVDNNQLPVADLTGTSLLLAPDAPAIFDSSGMLDWEGGFINPYGIVLTNYKIKTNSFLANSILSYQILPDLFLKTSLGYTETQSAEVRSVPLKAINPANYSYQKAASYFSDNSINSWIIEPHINWKKGFGKLRLDLLLGTTFQQDLRQGQILFATGYTSDELLGSLSAAARISSRGEIYSLYRYNAGFGRININLDNKYLLNLTGRRDGSSRFGPGKQFANFGAVGLAWIFSREKWIQDLFPFISFGKLRSSYGITGNDQIGDYQYLSNWSPTDFPYQGNAGNYPVNISNPIYSWETNKKWEGGLEIGFWKDRLLMNASYFLNRSSNQLVGYSLPFITGFSSIQANLPAIIQNSGMELSINSENIKTANFDWNTSINFTIPSNKLISYPQLAESGYAYQYVVGKSLYVRPSFHGTGVDPQSGVYFFETGSNGQSGNSPVYPDDLLPYKAIVQNYYGGFLNSFRYGNFRLNIFFQFVSQTGRNNMYYFGAPGFYGNQPATVLNRWQKPGDRTSVQKFTQDYSSSAFNSYENANYYGDNTIGDASFIRLKNLSLSYQIGGKLGHMLTLKTASIYLQGQNLLTISNYPGMDPELQGVGSLPPLRTVTAGIRITF